MRRRTLLLNAAFAFQGEQWRPLTALRCSLGLAVPIILAAALGHAAWGVLAALGALTAGLASFTGVTRSRLQLMLGTASVTGAVTVLAILVGPSAAGTALVVALAGVTAVLYGGMGAANTTVGLQAMTGLIVLSSLGLPTDFAWLGGALVLGGGLLQVGLLLVVWPVRRHQAERRAVARTYRRLERLLAGLPAGGAGDDALVPPEATPLQTAWGVLDEARSYRWDGEHQALRQALRTAEGLRAALLGYGQADREWRGSGPRGQAEAARLAGALGAALRDVEVGVRRGRVGFSPRARAQVVAALPDPGSDLRGWADLMLRLLDNLNAQPPVGAARASPPTPSHAAPAPRTTGAALLRLPDARALRGPLGRHALTYGVLLAVSAYLVRALHVPHGYWLVLTLAVVLRQDYVTTLTRGVARLGGTLAGVATAEVLLWAIHPAGAVLAYLSIGAAFLAFALFQAGYAAFSWAITLYVLLSVGASGFPEGAAAAERLGFTLLGGLLALSAYLLWPTWRSGDIGGVFRDAVSAQRAYLSAVRTLAAPPADAPADPAEAASAARAEARRLRVQAEDVVRASALEPSWGTPRATLAWAQAALRQLNANAAQTLTLHAQALGHTTPVHPDALQDSERQLEALAREVEQGVG